MKAALESSVRYIAAELADLKIRAHAISAGPLNTRTASRINRIDELLDEVRARHAGGSTCDDRGDRPRRGLFGKRCWRTAFRLRYLCDNGFHTMA